jgi:hypothetical protein
MAILSSSTPLEGISGTLGKELVFKKYGDKTVVSRYPDMSHVKPTLLQQEKRKLFAEAVAYAREIARNPVKKATYTEKLPPGTSVYHFALKEYLQLKKEG